MATTTQTVIIDFQADFSSLQDAVSILEKTGKVDADLAAQFRKTTTEVKKQGDALDKAAQSATKDVQSFSKLSDLMKQFPKSGLNRFLLQIGNELAGAGLKAEDFYKKLDPKDAPAKQATLRNELKQVREQMQAAALAGGVLGEEYKRLKQRAGELDDTIKDVSNDIANAGSDTRGIDNVVGSISALAGGFSAVQGAAALFGDESEDLQKALLKVNAAMALATGLQQIAAATTKQGSLTRLADATATGFQIVAQRLYDATLKGSIVSLKAFKIALAATGIGLVVIGLIALTNWLGNSKDKTEELNDALADLQARNDGLVRSINRNTELSIALANEQGKSQSEQLKISLAAKQKELDANKTLENQQRAIALNTAKNGKIRKEAADAINETFEKSLTLTNEISVLESNIRRQTAEELKQDAEKREQLSKDAAAKNKERLEKQREEADKLRRAEFEDFQAGIELKLLATEQGSREELELQKKLLQAKLLIDLEAENLTNNQRKLLIQTYFKDRKELNKKFSQEETAQVLADQKNRLSAELENLNINEEDKLSAKISFLQLSAAEEVLQAEGNAARIKAINAKLNADIATAKVESIKKSAADEAALLEATGGSGKRALEATAANERLKSEIRINAIRQVAQIEISAIDRQIEANRKAAQVQGADQKALELEYEILMDRKAQKTEETEAKITGIVEAENQKRRDSDIAYIQATLAGLQEISSIVAGIQSNQQSAAEQAIERQKNEVAELLEAGAITEKEAIRRNKKIEQEERQAKNRAAQQQKNLAIFNAALAIPQAFIAGLTAPFPIGGPIYGAILAGLAAVQLGIVASRPVPKFATGKKGSYYGIGEVGEAGAELIQRADGRMEVAPKRTLTYLGSRDKVFTASETKQMMPFVNKEAIAASGARETFNYEKLAKAVKQKEGNSTVVNIDKEFISESVANGLNKANYFDKYYSSKG